MPLYEELPRLERMAAKVRVVHGDRDPVRLAALVRLVSELQSELYGHMMKEERVLFPAIAQGLGPRVGMPIRIMRRNHDTMRHQLDDELTAHMPPENHVLLPRALRR